MIKKNCLQCQNIFNAKNTIWHTKNNREKYCSKICSQKAHDKKINKNCLVCNKEYKVSPYRTNITKYCSYKCGLLISIGEKGYWYNKKRLELINIHAKDSMFKQGEIPWNKDLKGFGKFNKGKLKPSMRGVNHPLWKGGTTSQAMIIRKSSQMDDWRKLIFERDNYTCQMCADNKGGNLNANHIKKFSDYPELRFVLTNGITLCRNCHIKIVTHHELSWESYFRFNLMTRGFIQDKHISNNL